MSEDHFSILGVSKNATKEQIKARYRFLCHAYHPDKFSSENHRVIAEEEFKRINNAYKAISASPSEVPPSDFPQPQRTSESSQEPSYHQETARQSPPKPVNPKQYERSRTSTDSAIFWRVYKSIFLVGWVALTIYSFRSSPNILSASMTGALMSSLFSIIPARIVYEILLRSR